MNVMHVPDPNRYDSAVFRSCGKSGIKLPPISLGLLQNFGEPEVV